ncbi:hypothetical protein AV530_013068 [Patagioenas fasciata monilis]|uniref:Uncharacterized protein n=1 Tax=Patagioenas fasciata monilis TaxID=372326 RepID=A0A1V4J9L6_PATFA|nr:hypothetical protein AV530_013068 [Patagioenas fasciata monilis]
MSRWLLALTPRTVWGAPIHPLVASPRTGSCSHWQTLLLGGTSQDSLLISLMCLLCGELSPAKQLPRFKIWPSFLDPERSPALIAIMPGVCI